MIQALEPRGDDSVTVRLDRKNVRVSVNGRVTRVPLKGLNATLDTGDGDDRVYAAGPNVDVEPGAGENSVALGPAGGRVEGPTYGSAIGHTIVIGNGGVLDVRFYNGSTATVRFIGAQASVSTKPAIGLDDRQAANDVRLTVTGSASVTTGDDDDRIDARGSTGPVFVDPGPGLGRDVAVDSFGNNTILGGPGRDSVVTGDGADSLSGGDDDDTLRGGGGGGQNRLYAGDP